MSNPNLKAVKVASIAFAVIATVIAIIWGLVAVFAMLFGRVGPLIWMAAVVFGGLFLAARLDIRDQENRK